MGIRASADWPNCLNNIGKKDSKIDFEMRYRCRGNMWTMCEFHDSNCNGFGDMWWTDKCIYFSSIDGVLVEQVDSVKYPRHFLTCELSDDIYIRRQCRELNVRGNILRRTFHMCRVPVKLKLFNSYCSSLYTPHLWWNYKNVSVAKLQISFQNILKRNIGLSKYDSTSATCASTNTQYCQSTIRNLVFKFMCRLNNLTMH